MGVLGLWQILSSTGRPVTLESLENQILAVDVSIWMNQAVRGVKERRGIAITDAHMLVMFHRICKLLHYRIKPIFVFDGPPPVVKQRLLERRRRERATANDKLQKLTTKLVQNLLHQHAVENVLATKNGKLKKQTSPEKVDLTVGKSGGDGDMFELPDDTVEKDGSGLSAESGESDDELFPAAVRQTDLDEIDINSHYFKCLPPEVKHEILIELQAQRKRPSWKHVDRLPQDSEKFSMFQIDRLMKRRVVQRTIDSNAKEMNSKRTGDIVEHLNHRVNLTDSQLDIDTRRIASTDSGHSVLLKKKPILSSSEQTARAIDVSMPHPVIEINDEEEDFVPVEDNGLQDSTAVQVHGTSSFADSSRDSSSVSHFRENAAGSSSSNVSLPQVVQPEVVICDAPNLTQRRISANLEKLAGELRMTRDIASSQSHNNGTCSSVVPDVITVQVGPENDVISLSDCSLSVVGPLEKAVVTVDISSDDEVFEHKKRPKWDSSDSDDDFEEVPEKSQPSSPVNMQESNEEDSASVRGISVSSPVVPAHTSVSDNADKSLQNDVPEVNDSEMDVDSLDFLDTRDDHLFPMADVEVESMRDSDLNGDTESQGSDPDELTVEELANLQTHLENEGREMRDQRSKAEKIATSVTEQLRIDCQELLQLFGIPFVNSPGEAEAQCAYMDAAKLCHGTITDDSDIWLFGGRKVYKNFFNQKRLVEGYDVEDVQSQLGLNRNKLIAFGLLTGSDYTEGIESVGGVRAIEIMAEFNTDGGIDCLHQFRQWYDGVQERRARGDHRPENKLRSQLADLPLAEIFPDPVVIQAYLQPDVDQSTEKFTWGVPALDLLREYARRRFGWNQQKVDGVLLPIIKRINSHDTQTRLESFLTLQLKQTNLGVSSRRFGAAIEKIKQSSQKDTNSQAEEDGLVLESVAKEQSKKRTRRTKSTTSTCSGTTRGKADGVDPVNGVHTDEVAQKGPRRMWKKT